MRGAVVLTVLIILLLLAPYLYQPILKNNYERLVQDKQALDSLVQLVEAGMAQPATVPETVSNLQHFDPNEAAKDVFLSVGIPNHIASRIIKYRNSGGKFYVKKDLQKIYGLTEAMYAQIMPYIMLPDTYPKRTKARVSTNIQKQIDINLADTTQLVQLRGIGTVLSERIVKFRNILGGYYAIDQLKDVYGISDLAMKSLQTHTFVAKGYVPQQLQINEADFKTLVRHPYISYEMAKAIMNHQQSYGPYTEANQLKEIPIITDTIFNKLKPYIAI